MNVKNNISVVYKTPTRLVLRIFRFMKFGTGTRYYLLISDYGFLPNNIITKQLFS
ncbi:hypothetical protein Hanom_Chr15g01378991 [Helianthus anomalus]